MSYYHIVDVRWEGEWFVGCERFSCFATFLFFFSLKESPKGANIIMMQRRGSIALAPEWRHTQRSARTCLQWVFHPHLSVPRQLNWTSPLQNSKVGTKIEYHQTKNDKSRTQWLYLYQFIHTCRLDLLMNNQSRTWNWHSLMCKPNSVLSR